MRIHHLIAVSLALAVAVAGAVCFAREGAKQKQIYNETADAHAEIKEALEKARADHKRVIVVFWQAGADSELAAGPVPAADFGQEPAKPQGAQHVFGIIRCRHRVLPRQIGNGRIQSRRSPGRKHVLISPAKRRAAVV